MPLFAALLLIQMLLCSVTPQHICHVCSLVCQ